ncbi:right-handed parallel beta-helix repeat-containing protein [Paraburkholderia sp. IW21]|uniref:right-handed parallel beta-helix repeat-containing protein n=1 Tax=Paraburkholderia sp. IW21 TaxID=3242488 RepID=UPI0035225FE0
MASKKTDTQEKSIDVHSAMRRKVFSTLLLGAGSLALTACGGGSDAGTSSADAVANRQKGARKPASASGASSASAPQAASSTNTNGVLLDTSFGVKGDGTTNDRVALQAAIDGSVGQILLITGKSRIDAKGLDLRQSSHIRFAQGASIKLLPHNLQVYQMVRVWDVDGVIIENAYLDGSKELNSARTGEWGMGISINGATNLTLSSPTTINCWGDGIYLDNSCSGSNAYSKNITIDNHHADGCRRQGMSIGSVSGLVMNNPLWENIGGTAPGCGLDIEPSDSATVLENIKIISPTTRNCAGPGIQVELGSFAGTQAKKVSISIDGHTDVSSKVCAFDVTDLHLNGYPVTGTITSTNPVWNVPLNQAFLFTDWDAAGPKVSVINPRIVS